MKILLIPVLLFGMMFLAPLHAEEDTPLGKQMEEVDDAYKALRRTEDAEEGAKLARTAQDGVLKAITMTPGFIEEGNHPGGKEKAMASYRKQMGQLFVTFCEVEEAFLAKDFDKVQELIKPLKASKKKGHNEFMEEE